MYVCVLFQLQSWDSNVAALQAKVTDLTNTVAVKDREIAAHVQNASSLQEKNCQLTNEVECFLVALFVFSLEWFALYFIASLILDFHSWMSSGYWTESHQTVQQKIFHCCFKCGCFVLYFWCSPKLWKVLDNGIRYSWDLPEIKNCYASDVFLFVCCWCCWWRLCS